MIYHVFNKSIADFLIFNTDADFTRFITAVKFYASDQKKSISSELFDAKKCGEVFVCNGGGNKLINIVCYVIMPTHFHLIVNDFNDDYISKYMNDIQNSYTRYFNLKHKRKGPLWQSSYKKIPIKRDEYLIHLTRYIHLNPVTAFLVSKPEDWKYSSYQEYTNGEEINCVYKNCFPENYNFKKFYKEFVYDRIDYQRQLSFIKNSIIE
ncbi:MAG: transposase [Elusimicrobiales bacterium]|nr:transposase [Elusimicrobiales bacterium]